MKKSIILICLLFACNLLIAKDKTFFTKQSKYSFIGMYESSNLEATDGFKYYIIINEDDFEGGRLLYTVVGNNYDKMKSFLTDMYRTGNKLKEPLWAFYPDYYETLHDDLILHYRNEEIDSKHNMIIEQAIWELK